VGGVPGFARGRFYVEEYKEAVDTRAVLGAFNATNSGTEAPAPAEGKNDRGE
jgi:hypothetical protein